MTEREINERAKNNFDEKNIESVTQHLDDDIPMFGMFANESVSEPVDIKPSEKSRKIAARSLLR